MMYGANNNEFRIFSAHYFSVQFVSLPFRLRKNLNMAATPLISVAKRLLANVDADHADYSETIVNVAVRSYSDTDRFEREVENIFLRSPLLVALSCDLREHGDFASLVIAGRPILVVRGRTVAPSWRTSSADGRYSLIATSRSSERSRAL